MEKGRKLQEGAYRLASTARKPADAKTLEAEELLKEIEYLAGKAD